MTQDFTLPTAEIGERLHAILPVSRETRDKLQLYCTALIAENESHNLIAASTIPDIWSRHILDSAQLIQVAEGAGGASRHWLDIGSGAGLPGLVIAILTGEAVTLVEPRRLRVDFLKKMTDLLHLPHCQVIHGKVENLRAHCFDVITARAVAPLGELFDMAGHLADDGTCWVLPKGKNATKELELARRSWQGDFTVIPSVTDMAASIIIARHVRSKTKGDKRP